MVLSAFPPPASVMVVIFVLMTQMSGQRHVRIGTALNTTGNVKISQGAFQMTGYVMETPGGKAGAMMGQMSQRNSVRTGIAQKVLRVCVGNVLIIYSAYLSQMCVMKGKIVIMVQMKGRSVYTGPVLMTSGNVLIFPSVSQITGCVTQERIVVMDQMSGMKLVRSGTSQKDAGNVQTIQGALETGIFVTDHHGMIAKIDLMSGMRHVRTGTAQMEGGNVMFHFNAFLAARYVMDMSAALKYLMILMSGLRLVRIGTVLNGSGNVLIIYNASMNYICVMETLTAMMSQMSGKEHARIMFADNLTPNVLTTHVSR